VTVGGEVGKVIISDQLEPAQRIKVAIHELAHTR
jgi:predicted metallopeptidase